MLLGITINQGGGVVEEQELDRNDDPVGYISLRKYVGQTEDSSLCGIPTTVQLDSL